LIYFFKGKGSVGGIPKNNGIPAVVLYELEYGIARSASPGKSMEQLEELCALIEVLTFGIAEAKVSAGIRAALEKKARR